MGDIIRKIVSFVVLIAGILAIVSFFINASNLIIDPFKAAFDPFDFKNFGDALWGCLYNLGIPLILIMLGLMGLTLADKNPENPKKSKKSK